jgi:hypothetical protein
LFRNARLIPSSVLESTALAATPPPPQGADVVMTAARRGAAAMARGSAPPWPLLLDIEVLSRSWPNYPRLRPLRAQTPATAAYDEWLRQFVSRSIRYLGISRTRRRDDGVPGPDLTFLLAEHFPLAKPQPDLCSGFRCLAEGLSVGPVLSWWQGVRTARNWQHCYPGPLVEFEPRDWKSGAWAQLSAAIGSDWLEERCDHEAARIYFEAANPKPEHDQKRRIWRLISRRPLQEPNPLTQSYEDQSRHYGATAMATLASGEYGEFKIVNRADYRLSNPPPVRPPPSVHIHLCWAHACSGIARTVDAPEFPGSQQKPATARASEASILQAFSALLLDDWRSALALANVRFYAHCGSPNDKQDDFGWPGTRWKPSKIGEPMPPPRFLARFFQRVDWCSVAQRGICLNKTRSRHHWWCLVLLKSDLEDFKIRPPSDDAREAYGALTVPTGVVPECISAVIVVDAAERNGTIYGVTSRLDGDTLDLFPIPARRPSHDRDPSLRGLRLQGLDALLDALEACT